MASSPRYIVPGKPVSWARAGNTRGRFWDTQKKLKHAWEMIVLAQHVKYYPGGKKFQGPLHLEAYFFWPIPASLPQAKRAALDNRLLPTKPDKDNLEKFICDCLEAMHLVDNDCLFATGYQEKRYSLNPRTEFIIKEWDSE